jgi:hypothetical protein
MIVIIQTDTYEPTGPLQRCGSSRRRYRFSELRARAANTCSKPYNFTSELEDAGRFLSGRILCMSKVKRDVDDHVLLATNHLAAA